MLEASDSEPQRVRPDAVGRAGIRLAAALMALLVLASIGGFLAHERSQSLKDAAALSERRAGRLAGELGDAHAVAAAAVQRIEARLQQLPPGAAAAGALAALAAEQRPLLAALPMPLRLVVLGADGRPLVADAVAPGEPEPLPTADGWQVGLTRGAAGRRSVPVLRRAAPNQQGVAAFVVELDHAALLARLESSRTPDGGSAALFRIEADGDTILLARAPVAEAEIGRRVRGPMAAAVARTPRGSFSAKTQLDQVRRTVAYQRLDDELAELVVAYGMASDAVLGDWRAQLPWAAGAAMLLLGGIGAGARRLESALQTQAEQLQALQRSEAQFRALATNLPDVVVRLDRDGRHLYANPAVEQATGLPPQAFVGKTNAELGMPADRVERWVACLKRVFDGGQPERLDFDYPGPAGLRHWESRVLLEPQPPGAEPTALVISRDITERVQGEQERQRLASILEATSDIVSMADPEGHLIYLNGPGRAMLGIGPGGSLPAVIASVHPQWSADLLLSDGLPTAIQDGRWSGETAVLGPGGEEIPMSQVILSHKDPQGKLLFLSTIMRDIRASRAAQQALQLSEQQLREAQQLASIGSWVLDMGSGALEWSDEVFRIFELDPGSFKADYAHFLAAIHPDDRAAVDQAWQTAVAGHGDYAIVHRLLLPNGSIKHVHARGRCSYAQDGTPLRALGTVQDITTRVQAEQALRDSEERLRLALEAAQQGLYDLDLRTGEAVVSPEYALMLGYDPADFHETNAAWRDRLHPDDRALVEQTYVDYVAGLRPDYRVEFRQRLRDGGWKWILSIGRIQERDADGQPLRMLGTHTDLDAIKVAQAALEESESRSRVLFDASPVPTLAYERGSLRLLAVNEAFTRLYGYSRDEALALHIPDLYPPELRAAMVELAARAQGLNHVTDIQHLCKDGRRIDVETRSHDFAVDGRPGRISVIIDVTEQRRAEAERRAAIERFQKLFEAAPEAISVSELDSGRFMLVNDAFCELFGHPSERVVGRTSRELAMWTDAPARETIVQRLRANQRVQGFEGVARRGDGQYINVLFSAERIEFGGLEALLLIFRDISERKRLDAALRASEKRFRVAASFGQVWEWDFGDGTIAPSSEFFASLGHGNVEGAQQMAVFERIVPEDDLLRIREALRRHLRREAPYHLEFRAFDAQGQVRWFETWGQALFDEPGGPARYVAGTTFEITERKQAEEQVRQLAAELEQRVQERTAQLVQSEARYRAIFDTVPISIGEEDWSAVQRLLRGLRHQGVTDGPAYFAAHPEIVLDCLRAVTVRRLNRKALALHDAQSQATDLRDLQAFYPKTEDLPQFVGELEAMWAGQRLFTAKRSLPAVSGRPLSLMMSMSLPHLDDDDGTALVCLVDISEIDRLNAELDRSIARLTQVNRELETFTYSVSHDLKAPLRGIDGYSRLLLIDHADALDDEGRQFLQHIRQATQHMGVLIDDLLAYSRLERRDLALATLPLAGVVDSVLAGRRQDLDAAGVQLDVTVDPELRARADAQGLTIALRNLVDNAVKFSRASTPPRIIIVARRSKDGVQLTVQDNGVGFDMKFRDRIFSIFQRLHRAEDYEGTGIGLAIVRKAVDRMGGRVWAESQPGLGANFTIELPEAS